METSPEKKPKTTTTTELVGPHRYAREARLGAGTFGVVYLARDLNRDRAKVAVKRIKPPGKFVDGVSWTALREIKVLREVAHENVVNLLDVFVHDEKVHLVFEFCTYDLEKVVRDPTIILYESEVAAYLTMLLRGLEALHGVWVLHRDLKPSNLLIDERGVLKIGDFGLARVFAMCEGVDRVSDMTSQVVTLFYRAPELLFGAKDYGVGVDMWSVGCIMAELMTRSPFFPGSSEIDQLGRIFHALGTPTEEEWPGMTHLPSYMAFNRVEPVPLQTHFRAASPRAVGLLRALLQFDPAKRLTASEALKHDFFTAPDAPKPTPCADLPRPGSGGNPGNANSSALAGAGVPRR